jgi:unsaturated chondroitin disaccharide hydrolase
LLMPIQIDQTLTPAKLLQKIERLFDLSAEKLVQLERTWDPAKDTPVFTVSGRYTSRQWTEWTQGFQFGSALLQYDATGEKDFLQLGRAHTIEHMASHVSHVGVHDHGFNNISTYGNLWRLQREGKLDADSSERPFYELALKVSGAVQAARWSRTAEGGGYIYSFNGPHSLFIDTMRSLRSLAVAHQLGHMLMGEHDERISLLERMLQHATATARFALYYGEGRDAYDVRGRTAQESVFNTKDGYYRCPSTQQGYSPFSTWTRGLGWGLLGFAEELEFCHQLPRSEAPVVLRTGAEPQGIAACLPVLERAAVAAADYALEQTCRDGMPMWDTHAPGLVQLGDYLHRVSDPYNDFEPVDSSAGVILAQGLFRLGNYLLGKKNEAGRRYRQAALTIANTAFAEPYLSTKATHEGLLLHSVYHRPNQWDSIAPGQKIPNGESSMWGDYHARELALVLLREAKGEPAVTFFKPRPSSLT